MNHISRDALLQLSLLIDKEVAIESAKPGGLYLERGGRPAR